MFRIIDKRSSGKTGRLLLLAKDTGAVVVCSNPNAMREKAYAYGITGLDFLSYYEYDNDTRGMAQDKMFLIDNLDCYLDEHHVIGYTISDDDD